ncbi:hypothetical protein ABMY26_11520 [Azospirillum sp. HJ39]|uniref:hypothetical protein n=1 Tax=Azospirillum sp. HJ39 TaxID=3159496 RepID=UPI003557E4FC
MERPQSARSGNKVRIVHPDLTMLPFQMTQNVNKLPHDGIYGNKITIFYIRKFSMREGEEFQWPGYYILQPDGTIDIHVCYRPLNQDEVEEFEEAISVVFDLQPILRAYEVFELSHTEINSAIDDIQDMHGRLINSDFGGMPIIYDAKVLFIHRTMTFLSSFKSFLDHAETKIKRKYKENSSIHNNFIKETNYLYDNHFSYRFMSKLRTISQHVMLPISVFNINVEQQNDSNKPKHCVSIIAERKELLNGWGKWGARMEKELSELPDRINLLPIINEHAICIKKLFCSFIEIEKDKLNYASLCLNELLKAIDSPPGAVPVLWITQNPKIDIEPTRSKIPPFEDVRRILNIIG